MSTCFARRVDVVEARIMVDELATYLLKCIAGGAGFQSLRCATRAEVLGYWNDVIDQVEMGKRILLVATRSSELLGSVQVVNLPLTENSNRAYLEMMLVEDIMCREAVRSTLLATAEAHAHAEGWWLLLSESNGRDFNAFLTSNGWRYLGDVHSSVQIDGGVLQDTSLLTKNLRETGTVTVSLESPNQPDILYLIDAAEKFAASLYPSESNYGLAIDGLLSPDIHFFVARRDEVAVGCGALRLWGDQSGEVKSMFVSPRLRGYRIGSRILNEIERKAAGEGRRLLKLETGIYNAAALSLYRRHGFRPTVAFPPYAPDPWSVFMAKEIA